MDLIERQAAIDAIDRIMDINYSDWIRVHNAIRHLPSAQPEIKCIAKVTLTDEQVKEAFEKAKMEILALQPDLQPTCNKLATDCKWKKNIILEIDKTIEEVKHNGKYHAKFVRENGELVIFGLEIAKHIIEKGEDDGQTD